MDPITTPKKEQTNEVAQPQTELVQEQPVTPEVLPVVEVAEQTSEIPAVVGTEQSEATPPILEGEQVSETILEQPSAKTEQSEVTPPISEVVPPAPPIPVVPVKPVKDRLEKEIEEVLEQDLKDLYLSMPKDKQQEFRKKGEETISAIRQLVHEAHKNVKKIFQLIRAWLKLIPGVNRYFLEQEAKIKTDKVLFVSDEEKRRGSKL